MVVNRWNREKIYCTAEYWDSKATEQRGDAVSMWPNNCLNAHYYEEIAATYAKHFPDLAGKRVLEIGCGTGRNCRLLASRGADVTGIDFSAKAVEIARSQSSGENPQYRVQSIMDIDDRDAYDVVLSWGTITIACTHREQVADLMRRLAASLRSEGQMLLLEPIHKGFLHRVLAMDLADFLGVMRSAGFRIAEVHHMHFWPTRLLLAYVPWPPPITTPIYRLGQGIMESVFRGRAGGDYQAVLASRGW